MTQFVTKEAFERMVTLQKGYIDSKLFEKQNRFTVGNGLSLLDGVLSVTLDTNLFKIVTILPDVPAAADLNKLFLVLKPNAENGNTYIEYIYLGAEKGWEKVGEWTPDIDLTPYIKKVDLTAEVLATGFSLAIAGEKFLEVALADTDFTGAVDGNKITLALKSITTAKDTGFYKFKLDAKGRVTTVVEVSKQDIIDLGFSSTEAMTQAITAAVEAEKTNREAADTILQEAITEEAKNRSEADATLASTIEAVNTKVTALEEAENNRSNLTVEETEELYNSIYGTENA